MYVICDRQRVSIARSHTADSGRGKCVLFHLWMGSVRPMKSFIITPDAGPRSKPAQQHFICWVFVDFGRHSHVHCTLIRNHSNTGFGLSLFERQSPEHIRTIHVHTLTLRCFHSPSDHGFTRWHLKALLNSSTSR